MEKKEEQQVQDLDVSEGEKVLPSKKSKKNYLFFFLILALLIPGTLGAIYFFFPSVFSEIDPFNVPTLTTFSPETIQEPTAERSISIPPVVEESIVLEEQPQIEYEETDIPKDNSDEVLVLSEISQPVVIEEPERKINMEQDIPLFQHEEAREDKEEEHAVPKKTDGYNFSVLKAIQLRDALKQGEECRPLLEELMALPNKTPEIEKGLIDLLQACLDRPLSGQIQSAFKKAKKRAILRIFQNDNATYLAYLKAIPYFIADVRHKTPTGNSPMDILSRLQEAVNSDRPQLVLKLIPELPDNVQSTLYDVQQYATHEADLYHSFNKIMHVLFAEGGSND